MCGMRKMEINIHDQLDIARAYTQDHMHMTESNHVVLKTECATLYGHFRFVSHHQQDSLWHHRVTHVHVDHGVSSPPL